MDPIIIFPPPPGPGCLPVVCQCTCPAAPPPDGFLMSLLDFFNI